MFFSCTSRGCHMRSSPLEHTVMSIMVIKLIINKDQFRLSLTCYHNPRRQNHCFHRGPHWRGTSRKERRRCRSQSPWCCLCSLRLTARRSPRLPPLKLREAAAGTARRQLRTPAPDSDCLWRCCWLYSSLHLHLPPGLLEDGSELWTGQFVLKKLSVSLKHWVCVSDVKTGQWTTLEPDF